MPTNERQIVATTLETTNTTSWRDVGWRDCRLLDAYGRILGGYKHEWRTYTAWYERKNLGDYIDEESAKAAVERAHRTNG